MTTRLLYPTLILSQSKKYLEIILRMSMVRKREEAARSYSICRAMSPRRSLVAKIRPASDRPNLRTPFRWLMQWPLELKLDRGNWIARITVGCRALTSCSSMSFRRGRRWYSKMSSRCNPISPTSSRTFKMPIQVTSSLPVFRKAKNCNLSLKITHWRWTLGETHHMLRLIPSKKKISLTIKRLSRLLIWPLYHSLCRRLQPRLILECQSIWSLHPLIRTIVRSAPKLPRAKISAGGNATLSNKQEMLIVTLLALWTLTLRITASMKITTNRQSFIHRRIKTAKMETRTQ